MWNNNANQIKNMRILINAEMHCDFDDFISVCFNESDMYCEVSIGNMVFVIMSPIEA